VFLGFTRTYGRTWAPCLTLYLISQNVIFHGFSSVRGLPHEAWPATTLECQNSKHCCFHLRPHESLQNLVSLRLN
jgi:hypothetical protein